MLQDSRRDAPTDARGDLVLLEHQDRTRWDQEAIDEALPLVEQALRWGRVGPYQIQAAIAALHAEAPVAAETDWPQIVALYEKLEQLTPSPVVRLNRAVALAMDEGAEAGLAAITELETDGSLRDYHLLHAARADLLRRLRRRQEAVAAYRQALLLTENGAERRMRELDAATADAD